MTQRVEQNEQTAVGDDNEHVRMWASFYFIFWSPSAFFLSSIWLPVYLWDTAVQTTTAAAAVESPWWTPAACVWAC